MANKLKKQKIVANTLKKHKIVANTLKKQRLQSLHQSIIRILSSFWTYRLLEFNENIEKLHHGYSLI